MNAQLIHGDCLRMLPALPPASVHAVIADLPYAVTAAKWDVQIDLVRFWAEVRRVATPSAQCVFTANMRLAHALIESNPRQFRHDLVWHKQGRPSGYLQASKQPLRCHEHILVFSLGPRPTYNPQMVAGKPHNRSAYSTANSGGEAFKVRQQRIKVNHGTRFPQTIQVFPRLTGPQLHPTEKPVSLMQYLVQTYSNAGDTVLDPCMGSGSTGSACLSAGRKFIGIEKEEVYFQRASKRIASETAQECLAI